MVMVSSNNMVAEARSTAFYPTMASPRYGACVSAFLHFFDWTPAKRFFFTKRLSGQKAEKGACRRPRSLRGNHGVSGKPRRVRESRTGSVVLDHVADGTRAPGVVARLMGLESLPQPAHHRRAGDACIPKTGAPILLQDLLKRDYRAAKKKRRTTTSTLRDRFPAIFPRRAGARDGSMRSARKSRRSASLLTAFRCRPEVSPAYIDMPATSRFLYSVARSPAGASSFLSRLPQLQTPHESPLSCDLSRLQEKIPELSLRASSTGTSMMLQGWPLGSQHIVPQDIFHEDEDDSSSSSTDSAPSQPLDMAIGRYKAKRRGSSWNRSESKNFEQEEVEVYWKPSARRAAASLSSDEQSGHRRRSTEPVFKTTQRSATPKRGSALNARGSSSHESVSTSSSMRSVSSKPPVDLSGTSNSDSNTSMAQQRIVDAETTKRKSKEDDPHRFRKTAAASRSKEIGKSSPPKAKISQRRPATRADSSSAAAHQIGGDAVLPISSYGARLFGGRKERRVTKLRGGGELSPESPAREKLSAKAIGVAGRQATRGEMAQELGARLKVPENGIGATQSSSAGARLNGGKIGETTTVKRLQYKHAKARSVDDVFPELPFDFADSRVDSSSEPRERVLWLFGHGISSSPEFDLCKCGQISSSPLVDFSSGACELGRLSDCLVDYDELPCLGEYEKETEILDRISSSPLIDCDELCSLAGSGAPEDEACIHGKLCQDQEFGKVGDLSWEDADVVETLELSGRCCEQTCSGPSVSSESLLSDDVEDERIAWSSYNNLAAWHSPRRFQVTEIDVEAESVNREHENSSPPAQFVKKNLDATELDPLVDEAGQPSPVSILNSPFHDEACTTPESSTTDSNIHRQLLSSEEIVDELNLPPSSSATSVSNSDKIRQALLAISTFRSEEESCAVEAQVMPQAETKDELSFIRGMLSAAQFLSTPGSSPNWHDKDRVIDPSLFDKLESGDVGEFSCQASGGLWRCDRKLLFDCVNEAFGLTRLRHCQGDQEGSWLQEELVWRSARPRGELLMVEVVKKVEEWRTLTAFAIDSLVEKDMSVYLGDWKCFMHEAAEVGLDIENKVWGDILEEIVGDMVLSTLK